MLFENIEPMIEAALEGFFEAAATLAKNWIGGQESRLDAVRSGCTW
jgi:hypothetical protein